MAEKDNKPKTTAKPAATSVKPTAAKPAATTKPAATVKPTSSTAAKPVTKPVATVKPAATAAEKPAAKPVTKPATATKPTAPAAAAKSSTAGKATVINAKPAATVKPVAAPATAPKSAAKPVTATAEAKPAQVNKTNAAPKSSAKPAPAPSAEKPKKAAVTAAKPEKAQKQPKEKKEKPAKAQKSGDSGKATAVAALSPKNLKIIIMSAVAFVLIIALVIGIVVGTKSCNKGGSSIPRFSSNDAPVTLGTTSVSEGKPVPKEAQLLNAVDTADMPTDPYSYEYSNTTAIGYYAELTGDTYERVRPVAEVKNEREAFDSESTGTIFDNGAKRYPTFGSTLRHVIGTSDEQVAARNVIISESGYLCAWGTAGANRGGEQTPDKYTRIDKDGYLYQYLNNEWIHSLVWGKTAEEYAPENYRQLYKHTAAEGMYLEGYTRNGVTYAVSDDAESVVKEVTMRARGYDGYGVTGLYAPAGEVVKIEISGKDMRATGGLAVHIGQALYNGQANNIWAAKNNMIRFPYILTTLYLNTSTCDYDADTDTWTGYVGSFVGGPIYIRNTNVKYTAKISGGLEYLHFILGYTTKDEFNRLKQNSKVPYFDLEVWTYGVLHSGARYYSETFSYDDIYKAAVLWEKVSSVTTSSSNQGIVFLYDPFVAAGAAVAFPGRRSVNCPQDWMTSSLNYNGIVTSGSWGNFHEYHHNFQNYGLGSGADGEVTNNALTLVSYALFTKISANRGIGSYGGQGLGGWNSYTSATWALQRINDGQITSTNGLAIYSTLLHNFGADAFLKARGTSGKNNYLNKWATVTHHDFTYYASLIGEYGGGNYTPSDAVKNANYPMFVPVSCVYQTGRSYMYDGEKQYFKTMQPYVIANAPFNIDLNRYTAPGGQYAGGSIVMPDGFSYRIKSVTKPANGSIEIVDNYNLKYTPAAGAKTGSTSGQIVVTLEIVKNDGKFEVEDVDLVLEFEISQEVNKMTLQRTTYTYTEANMYSDAVAAYEGNFAGFTSVNEKYNHTNPTQNANTDIWLYPDTEVNRENNPNAPEYHFAHDNTIEVIDGKLYASADGKYRVYLRGRLNCAVYFSVDGGNTYTLGAKINDNQTTDKFRLTDPNTYFDVEFAEGKVYVNGALIPQPIDADYSSADGERWIYVREVLIVNTTPTVSYIGLGMTQWTQAMFTMAETYHKADNTAVDSADDEEYAYTKVTYRDYSGAEVAYTRRDKDSAETQYYKKSGNSWVASTLEEVSQLTESRLIAPASATYVNAYRADYRFPDNSGFETEYFYIRSNNYTYIGDPANSSTWDDGVKIISCNKFPWDNNTKIDNLLTPGQETYFHSNNPSNYSNGPMILELDMGKDITANKITFYGRKPNPATTAQQGLPRQFSLEVSADGVNYTSAGEYTNGTGAAYSATVNLNATYDFRYVRITITNTHSNNKHFCLSGITFTYAFTLTGNGANHVSPANDSVVFSGNWEIEQGFSNFGVFYHGTSGSKINLSFTGTRLAVLTSTLQDNSFEVWIDGRKVDSIEVKQTTDSYGVTYISQLLEQGKHKVEIRCTGDTYIDSFALY